MSKIGSGGGTGLKGDNTLTQKGLVNGAAPITNNINAPMLGGSVNGNANVVGSLPVLGTLMGDLVC
jgi:hypothetical protein